MKIPSTTVPAENLHAWQAEAAKALQTCRLEKRDLADAALLHFKKGSEDFYSLVFLDIRGLPANRIFSASAALEWERGGARHPESAASLEILPAQELLNQAKALAVDWKHENFSEDIRIFAAFQPLEEGGRQAYPQAVRKTFTPADLQGLKPLPLESALKMADAARLQSWQAALLPLEKQPDHPLLPQFFALLAVGDKKVFPLTRTQTETFLTGSAVENVHEVHRRVPESATFTQQVIFSGERKVRKVSPLEFFAQEPLPYEDFLEQVESFREAENFNALFHAVNGAPLPVLDTSLLQLVEVKGERRLAVLRQKTPWQFFLLTKAQTDLWQAWCENEGSLLDPTGETLRLGDWVRPLPTEVLTRPRVGAPAPALAGAAVTVPVG